MKRFTETRPETESVSGNSNSKEFTFISKDIPGSEEKADKYIHYKRGKVEIQSNDRRAFLPIYIDLILVRILPLLALILSLIYGTRTAIDYFIKAQLLK
jgi:hypothetical protein